MDLIRGGFRRNLPPTLSSVPKKTTEMSLLQMKRVRAVYVRHLFSVLGTIFLRQITACSAEVAFSYLERTHIYDEMSLKRTRNN